MVNGNVDGRMRNFRSGERRTLLDTCSEVSVLETVKTIKAIAELTDFVDIDAIASFLRARLFNAILSSFESLDNSLKHTALGVEMTVAV